MAEAIGVLAAGIGGAPVAALPAVGGVAGGVAGGAAGSAAGSSIFGTALQTALSLTSAGLSIASGLSQGQALSNRAMIEDFNARQELIRGQFEANKIKENLIRTLATQNAYFGASGIDLGSGTPVDLATETQAQADRELDLVRTNATLLSTTRRFTALGYGADASAAQVGGFARGAMTLLDYGTRLAGR